MSAEGRLPRDEQEDGGLFDSLESLLSQRSDWELREWCDPNAHNDTGASVHEGGAAGDAPCVPRVRARGASPSLANVLALASARGAHRPNTRARPSATCTRHAGLTARGARRNAAALGARCRRVRAARCALGGMRTRAIGRRRTRSRSRSRSRARSPPDGQCSRSRGSGLAHAGSCGSAHRGSDLLSPLESDALHGLELLGECPQVLTEPQAAVAAPGDRSAACTLICANGCASPGCDGKRDGTNFLCMSCRGSRRSRTLLLAKVARWRQAFGASQPPWHAGSEVSAD